MRVFQEAKPAFSMLLAFVACEHRLGRERLVIQFIGGQEETALLAHALLTGRQRRGQGASIWESTRAGGAFRTRKPPLAIARGGVDGDLV